MSIEVGTAGWTIPRAVAARFPDQGSALERYASRLHIAEINSSFHRPHRASTWERWRDSVPAGFRFSAKLPKTITHVRKLVDCTAELDAFLAEAPLLGDKLGLLLVQLPPKLALDVETARRFFTDLSARTEAKIACEPRNPRWFTSEADSMLEELQVARVAADPAISPAAAVLGGWRGLDYWRLHGSPVMYRSSYADRIGALAAAIEAPGRSRDVWCIFDNTASSAALGDALALSEAVGAS